MSKNKKKITYFFKKNYFFYNIYFKVNHLKDKNTLKKINLHILRHYLHIQKLKIIQKYKINGILKFL